VKIGFNVHDVGPGKMLEDIADTAKTMGHNVVVVPPLQEHAALQMLPELEGCDVIAIGLSSLERGE